VQCLSGYYQLRQLRQAVQCSSVDATRTMVQAFITSRLDWCNALYYGISDELMRRLQSVQNAAARLITGTRRCDHISPVLRQLHWLPMHQRVNYKIATLVHWSLSRATWLTTDDSSPTPVSDDCVLPTLVHWSSVAHKALLAIEYLLRQHLGSGTVYRLI